MTIKSGAGATTLKKTSGVWQMTAPVSLKADAMEPGTITTNLSTLEVSRVVDENPADVKDYGLEPPQVEITFKASGDKTYGGDHRLLLGSKSPTGGDVFARRDADKRVILVPDISDRSSTARAFNLRDKTLLVFDRDKVDHIAVSAGTNRLEFARTASTGKLQPIAAGAGSRPSTRSSDGC